MELSLRIVLIEIPCIMMLRCFVIPRNSNRKIKDTKSKRMIFNRFRKAFTTWKFVLTSECLKIEFWIDYGEWWWCGADGKSAVTGVKKVRKCLWGFFWSAVAKIKFKENNLKWEITHQSLFQDESFYSADSRTREGDALFPSPSKISL